MDTAANNHRLKMPSELLTEKRHACLLLILSTLSMEQPWGVAVCACAPGCRPCDCHSWARASACAALDCRSWCAEASCSQLMVSHCGFHHLIRSRCQDSRAQHGQGAGIMYALRLSCKCRCGQGLRAWAPIKVSHASTSSLGAATHMGCGGVNGASAVAGRWNPSGGRTPLTLPFCCSSICTYINSSAISESQDYRIAPTGGLMDPAALLQTACSASDMATQTLYRAPQLLQLARQQSSAASEVHVGSGQC